jgi:hypothetical protein
MEYKCEAPPYAIKNVFRFNKQVFRKTKENSYKTLPLCTRYLHIGSRNMSEVFILEDLNNVLNRIRFRLDKKQTPP